MKPLVIYHAQCMDGFAAALAATMTFPDAELLPGFYGQPPPSVEALHRRHVILADFSYPRAVLRAMLDVVDGLDIYDHHATAKADLDGLAHPLLGVVFDMERSGAGIVWDSLHEDERPWLIDYVEDRDLWRYALPASREINAYVGTLPYEQPSDLRHWRDLMTRRLDDVMPLGRGAWAFLQSWAHAAAHSVARFVDVTLPDGAHYASIPIANVPQKGGSEVMEILAVGKPFAAYWSRRPDGRFNYGLRSTPGALDVSAIAKLYGGGGHKHAAGFVSDRILWEWLPA